MARATANKLYRTFTKGLITEAGFLTYPENASIDELNTVIKVKGSRSRRLGIDYEPGSTSITISNFNQNYWVSEYSWKNVGEDSDVNFLVVQVYTKIYFFNLNNQPITKETFEIDLMDYNVGSTVALDVGYKAAQFASGKGFLFVAHPLCEPLVVEYDPDTNTITTTNVLIQMRDFDGIDDSLGNEEQPTTLTKEHLYNLKNQGWAASYVQATAGGGGSLETGDIGYVNPNTGTRGTFNTVIP